MFDERQIIADQFAKPIQEGKPELGWAGDPTLVLTFHRIEQRWELLRHEPRRGQPERYVIEARGPVGAEINEGAINLLIQGLVSRDTTRRGNSHEEQLERLYKHNERVERQKHREAVEATSDGLARFYHEAGKAFGVTKTFFGQQP